MTRPCLICGLVHERSAIALETKCVIALRAEVARLCDELDHARAANRMLAELDLESTPTIKHAALEFEEEASAYDPALFEVKKQR